MRNWVYFVITDHHRGYRSTAKTWVVLIILFNIIKCIRVAGLPHLLMLFRITCRDARGREEIYYYYFFMKVHMPT